jgi:hypothetical protein
MKIALILLAVLLSGCGTIQHAKRDFRNFQKTIAVNAKAKAVYNMNHF